MADSSESSKTSSSSMSAGSVIGIVISLIVFALYSGGAAKLSYDRYGSIGWAFLAFIFAPIYYPVYAYFVSTKPTGMLGGMKKMLRF
jgi:hypothetical protein